MPDLTALTLVASLCTAANVQVTEVVGSIDLPLHSAIIRDCNSVSSKGWQCGPRCPRILWWRYLRWTHPWI